MDLYQRLGVQRGASEAEIKKAYRSLAKQLHPDRNKDNPNAAKRFGEVTAAYDLLSDKDKRARYDRGEIDEDGNPRMPFGGGFGGGGRPGGGPGGAGGRVNTDALDNSAGVSTSDHEVNIKITLSDAEREGALTRRQRDGLLAAMTDEVAALVLRDRAMEVPGVRSVRVEVSRRKVKARAQSHFRELDEVRADLDSALGEGIRQLGLARPLSLSVHVRRPSKR